MEHKIYDTAEEVRRAEELDELRHINQRLGSVAKQNQLIFKALDKLRVDKGCCQMIFFDVLFPQKEKVKLLGFLNYKSWKIFSF